MIFEGLTAYSFRIDLPDNEESSAEILKFFGKYNVNKYYGNPEIGEKTQKPHYQMIIWMGETSTQEITKMRNYWRGKVPTKKGGGVSLKKARDEEKLLGYCRKEEKNRILTNVSKEKYETYKKYQSLNAVKVEKAQKLEKLIGGISRKLDKYDYLEQLNKVYFEVYNKPNLFRNYYVKNLYRAGYMDNKDIIHYIFPHDVPGPIHNQEIYEPDHFEKNHKNNYYKN